MTPPPPLPSNMPTPIGSVGEAEPSGVGTHVPHNQGASSAWQGVKQTGRVSPFVPHRMMPFVPARKRPGAPMPTTKAPS